jgi:hypothetical protein
MILTVVCALGLKTLQASFRRTSVYVAHPVVLVVASMQGVTRITAVSSKKVLTLLVPA